MIVGVPKEKKKDEYRVAIMPVGVEEMVKNGHRVIFENGAGIGSGLPDSDYAKAGAEIVDDATYVFENAEMIMKIKEPLPEEYQYLRKGQIIFTFFHFAASRELTKVCLKSGILAIAYETMRDQEGKHPLLTPMSEVAGRMSIQEGAKYLEKPMEGKGILLGGVPGVSPAEVVIIGGGVVGTNAAKVAAGLGAMVTILDKNFERMRHLDDIMPKNVITLMSNAHNISTKIVEADLLVSAVLIEGAKTPILVTREMVKTMKPGTVIVDVSIDQGGCIETSRPTTHSNPIFIINEVVHYCVTNMPSAVGRTSSYALTNVSLQYALEIANKGYKKAAIENITIKRGIDMVEGKVTNKAVAEAFEMEFCELDQVL
ncbi:MAG: alanine dehydrogenase [Candidatus Scalinduaceae bacterium]